MNLRNKTDIHKEKTNVENETTKRIDNKPVNVFEHPKENGRGTK